MADQRARLPADERAARARAAVERLVALPAFAAARVRVAAGGAATISAYVAVRGELDPTGAVEAARAAGVTVALPRIDTRWPPHLRFHDVRGPQDLEDGPYGLSEPSRTRPEVALEALDVLIVPGLAFDPAGRRVGQGGGYYDAAGRLLREKKAPGLLVGFAYDFQIVDACPTDPHDVAVDVVVTDRRVLAAGGPS